MRHALAIGPDTPIRHRSTACKATLPSHRPGEKSIPSAGPGFTSTTNFSEGNKIAGDGSARTGRSGACQPAPCTSHRPVGHGHENPVWILGQTSMNPAWGNVPPTRRPHSPWVNGVERNAISREDFTAQESSPMPRQAGETRCHTQGGVDKIVGYGWVWAQFVRTPIVTAKPPKLRSATRRGSGSGVAPPGRPKGRTPHPRAPTRTFLVGQGRTPERADIGKGTKSGKEGRSPQKGSKVTCESPRLPQGNAKRLAYSQRLAS